MTLKQFYKLICKNYNFKDKLIEEMNEFAWCQTSQEKGKKINLEDVIRIIEVDKKDKDWSADNMLRHGIHMIKGTMFNHVKVINDNKLKKAVKMFYGFILDDYYDFMQDYFMCDSKEELLVGRRLKINKFILYFCMFCAYMSINDFLIEYYVAGNVSDASFDESLLFKKLKERVTEQ